MAVKRVVNIEFWTDDKVEGFTPKEKYFWLYLLTNPYSKQLGIYRITKKQMAFQLGYDIDTVEQLMNKFEHEYGLIRYIDNEIAIKNYLVHSILKGGKPVQDCINSDIKNVEHICLLEWVFDSMEHKKDKLSSTVVNVIEEWKKERSKERINDNHKHNHKHNHSIVDNLVNDSSTIREVTINSFAPTSDDIDAVEKEVFAVLPLLKNKEMPIYIEDLDEYRESFPALDIEQEIRNAIAWIRANPKNKKSNGKRFLTNWMIREQNKARASTTKPMKGDDIFYKNDTARIE